MTQKNRPLPWWPKSYAADEHVIPMSLESEGAYRRLLDYQWLHGSIPADMRLLAAICKNIPVQRMTRLWKELAACFHPKDGDPSRLVNRKLEREREKDDAFRQERSESGKAGAKAKWQKHSSANGSNMAQPANSLWPPSPTPSPPQTATAVVQSHSLHSEPEAQRRRGHKTEPQRLALVGMDDKVEAMRVLNQAARQADDASLEQRIARPP